MRLLVAICHYFGSKPETQQATIFSSQIEPIARIAATNSAIVALNRHFGPRRHADNPRSRIPGDETERELDIVILQVPGHGLLDSIGIDPSCYTVEYFDGPPPMLCFEAQRVLRDRFGGYDYYGVLEDDMVIHDPAFFEKLSWFEANFGVSALLQPTRYEMAQSGTPAIAAVSPSLSSSTLTPFRRDGQRSELVASWHGHRQSFTLPVNPHAGGYFLSNEQLAYWMKQRWFYDRDASWVGPIESAMNFSLGRTFDIYKPAAPDPLFLSIEHYGTRYAKSTAPAGITYGDTPLLEIAHAVLAMHPNELKSSDHHTLQGLISASHAGLNTLVNERDAILHELISLRRSRSELLKALWAALRRKGIRW